MKCPLQTKLNEYSNSFKVDIHYITGYITYKRYNKQQTQTHGRVHIHMYIHMYISTKYINIYKKTVSEINAKSVNSSNTQLFSSPRNHSRLFSSFFFALLDNWSRQCSTTLIHISCQWITFPLKQLLTT